MAAIMPNTIANAVSQDGQTYRHDDCNCKPELIGVRLATYDCPGSKLTKPEATLTYDTD